MPSSWFTVLYGIVGGLILAATAWRLRDALRDPGRPDLWAVCLALLFTGIGFLSATPPLYIAAARWTGIPNIATLVVYGSIVTCGGAMCVWTYYILAPKTDGVPTADAHRRGVRGARYILAATVAVLLTMATLFTLAPVEDSIHAIDFDDAYARVPLAVAFLAVYLTAYCTALIRIVWLCRRAWSTVVTVLWLRRGIRSLAIGALIALGYAAGKIVSIVGSWFGTPMHTLNIVIAPLLASIGASLMMVGYGISAAPKLLDRAIEVRTLRSIHRLWRILRAVAPNVELSIRHAARRPLANRLSVRERAYRRAIEILDWLNRLSPHLDPRVQQIAQRHADAARLRGIARDAAVEAARITVALHAWETQQEPRTSRGGEWHTPGPTTGEQLRMLAAIAEAYLAPSPVVTATLSELDITRQGAIMLP
ncbi:MAB_1171c family putative transporter [Amycolatopsis anabasis]|uniref:MAB_1171c family putative transporter n=1 Tax=Amycolatopsis anabasis TaxID=1840409 RepID=UPI00131BC2B5|nr:MAB_1171c family putative transporter [Amycolatopsis anabasis]